MAMPFWNPAGSAGASGDVGKASRMTSVEVARLGLGKLDIDALDGDSVR
jgi:hypothetical protein